MKTHHFLKTIKIASPIQVDSAEPTLESFRYHKQIIEHGAHRETRFFEKRYRFAIDLLEDYGFQLPNRGFLINSDDGAEPVPLMIYLVRQDLAELGELGKAVVYLLDLERQHAKAILTGRSTTAKDLSSKVHNLVLSLKEWQYVREYAIPSQITATRQSLGGKKSKYGRFMEEIIEPLVKDFVSNPQGTVEDVRFRIEEAIKGVEPHFRFGNGTKGFNELNKRTVENWVKKEREKRDSLPTI